MRDRFRAAGVPTAELDARLLAEASFGFRGIDLVTHEHDFATDAAVNVLEGFAARRLAGEPVARILGEKDFYGLTFKLVPATLVPRPDTELLVDLALGRLPALEPVRILDLGTGSGCIAIAILKHRLEAKAVAIDLSAAAIDCARKNAMRHQVAERFDGRVGDWFTPLLAEEQFDLILSNPPYIESGEIAELMPEVRVHDPALALDGGDSGLDAYRAIAAGAGRWLKPGGQLMLEIGSTQAAAVSALLVRAGFKDPEVKKDLAGLDRAVVVHHS